MKSAALLDKMLSSYDLADEVTTSAPAASPRAVA
jgi:4-hydroxyphenylacetate 3-monooxygenase